MLVYQRVCLKVFQIGFAYASDASAPVQPTWVAPLYRTAVRRMHCMGLIALAHWGASTPGAFAVTGPKHRWPSAATGHESSNIDIIVIIDIITYYIHM